MKKTQFKQILPAIQVLSIAAVLTILASSLVSFSIRSFSDDFLKQLGLSKPGAEEKIRHGFLSGSFDAYGVKNLKSIAAGSRVVLTNEIMTYSKKYVGSADFIKNYTEMRNYHKPAFQKIQTPAEMREQSIASFRKSVADMEESYKKADASMKPLFEKMLASNKAELKKAEDPNNKSVVNYANAYDDMVKSNQENYDRQIKAWEEKYPANHLLYVKKRLQEFMDETATVDFDAKVVTKGNKLYFENRAYESKGNRWKMAFRAGKDVVTVARNFAQQWMNEIK
ncbi:hypothetical protein [Lacibacter sp. H407]|uniref:hypothetical protein n=1 Tax=Lacibacter sp. H407 TaxID=3133423 RepID=UPI0030C0B304